MLAPAAGVIAIGIAAVIGVSGCASHDQALPAPAVPAVAVTGQGEPQGGGGLLPPSEMLGNVLYRLADTAIPGNEKLALVADTAPADTAALDAFGTALRDDGLSPITVTASDLRWSDNPSGRVLATVTIAAVDPDDPREFVFPMEFQADSGDWQLTRETAEMLLALGDAGTASAIPDSAAPPDGPSGQPPQPDSTPGG